jgi:hypothetical protein
MLIRPRPSWARASAPTQIVVDPDLDAPLHGRQEGRFFHGYYEGQPRGGGVARADPRGGSRISSIERSTPGRGAGAARPRRIDPRRGQPEIRRDRPALYEDVCCARGEPRQGMSGRSVFGSNLGRHCAPTAALVRLFAYVLRCGTDASGLLTRNSLTPPAAVSASACPFMRTNGAWPPPDWRRDRRA